MPTLHCKNKYCNFKTTQKTSAEFNHVIYIFVILTLCSRCERGTDVTLQTMSQVTCCQSLTAKDVHSISESESLYLRSTYNKCAGICFGGIADTYLSHGKYWHKGNKTEPHIGYIAKRQCRCNTLSPHCSNLGLPHETPNIYGKQCLCRCPNYHWMTGALKKYYNIGAPADIDNFNGLYRAHEAWG